MMKLGTPGRRRGARQGVDQAQVGQVVEAVGVAELRPAPAAGPPGVVGLRFGLDAAGQLPLALRLARTRSPLPVRSCATPRRCAAPARVPARAPSRWLLPGNGGRGGACRSPKAWTSRECAARRRVDGDRDDLAGLEPHLNGLRLREGAGMLRAVRLAAARVPAASSAVRSLVFILAVPILPRRSLRGRVPEAQAGRGPGGGRECASGSPGRQWRTLALRRGLPPPPESGRGHGVGLLSTVTARNFNPTSRRSARRSSVVCRSMTALPA